jgi:hypothetical protein
MRRAIQRFCGLAVVVALALPIAACSIIEYQVEKAVERILNVVEDVNDCAADHGTSVDIAAGKEPGDRNVYDLAALAAAYVAEQVSLLSLDPQNSSAFTKLYGLAGVALRACKEGILFDPLPNFATWDPSSPP